MTALRLHCRRCGIAFHGRADALYCGPACKQRAYRTRERRRAADQTVTPDAAVAQGNRIRREAVDTRRRAQAARRAAVLARGALPRHSG